MQPRIPRGLARGRAGSSCPDPIFAAIEAHRAACTAAIGLDDGRDKEGFEAAHDAGSRL